LEAEGAQGLCAIAAVAKSAARTMAGSARPENVSIV
jgi:hypothetical protein